MLPLSLSSTEYEFFEKLYEERFEHMVNYAGIKLHDSHGAYDVVQETFIAAYNDIQELMRSENPKGWLMNALNFNIMHERRARAKFILLYQKMLQALTEKSISQPSDDNNLGLSQILEETEFEVLRVIYVDNHTMREAADILGITYETCKKRVQKAKRILAGKLENDKVIR